MNDDDAWSIEKPRSPGSEHTIQGGDTLETVARRAAEILDLTPPNTEWFVADWLSEWERRALPATHTVDQAQAGESDGWVWDRLCWYVSQYTRYHTDQQLADFLVFNLIRITSKNVLKSLSVLAERRNDEEAQRLLLAAREAVKVLDGKELSELLHELAQPS